MNVIIDGRPIAFEGRPTILEVARANGIFIPSLCDHPGLEPFAACRVCMVEVKGRRGYVPACSTAAEDGQEVRTATSELAALRRGILELILAEHPNACLICAEKSSCDEYKSTIRKTGEVTGCVLCLANGRCQLQRVVEAVGIERVHFPSLRRPGEVRRDDPFIDRDNSLCILCGRCVRACHEVRGACVLTFVSRGSTTVVGTALDRRLLESECRFCGACVDVCPTGSLAERAVRYERLPETEKKTICPFCGQGCGLRIGLRDGRILGAAPDPEGAVNLGQACVKGRFLVKNAVHHPRRLLRPMVRKNGSLRESTWEEALAAAAERLGDAGGGQTAVAASAQSSCEDLFVLHKFASEVLKASAAAGPWPGSAAAGLRDLGRAAGQAFPLNFHLSDIGRAGTIMLFGEDLPVTQPIVGLAVNRAVRNGAALVGIGTEHARAGRRVTAKVEIPSGKESAFIEALTAIALKDRDLGPVKAAGFEKFKASRKTFGLSRALQALHIPEDRLLEIARFMKTCKPVVFLFGPGLLRTGGGGRSLAALNDLAVLTGATLIPLDWEASLRGGLEIAGAFPMETISGEELAASVSRPRFRTLYLAGPVPKLAPGAADLVIIQGSYDGENTAIADILLPETTSFESDGTFVNVEGRVQLAERVIEPLGESRPGWSILAGLAVKMGRSGFGYASAEDVRKDLALAVRAFGNLASNPVPPEGVFLMEAPAGPEAFIGDKAVGGPAAGPGPPALRNPDSYKGLNMAVENKSLKLIRER